MISNAIGSGNRKRQNLLADAEACQRYSQGNLYIGDVADESLTHRVQKFVRLPAER
jgi:hypothetical protein